MIIKHFKYASQKHLNRDTEVQKRLWWDSSIQDKSAAPSNSANKKIIKRTDQWKQQNHTKNFQYDRFENAEWILDESSQFLLTMWSAKKLELMTVFHRRKGDKMVKPVALSIN